MIPFKLWRFTRSYTFRLRCCRLLEHGRIRGNETWLMPAESWSESNRYRCIERDESPMIEFLRSSTPFLNRNGPLPILESDNVIAKLYLMQEMQGESLIVKRWSIELRSVVELQFFIGHSLIESLIANYQPLKRVIIKSYLRKFVAILSQHPRGLKFETTDGHFSNLKICIVQCQAKESLKY